MSTGVRFLELTSICEARRKLTLVVLHCSNYLLATFGSMMSCTEVKRRDMEPVQEPLIYGHGLYNAFDTFVSSETVSSQLKTFMEACRRMTMIPCLASIYCFTVS